MTGLKNICKRGFSLALAFIMVFSMIPSAALEVHAASAEDVAGVVGLDANGDYTVNGGTITVTATKGTGCGAANQTSTLTLTNNSEGTATLAFTWIAKADAGNVTINGSEIADPTLNVTQTFRPVTLTKGQSVTISAYSQDGGSSTTIEISNISLTGTVAFGAADGPGSYTITKNDGTTVAPGTSVTDPCGTIYTLVATANGGATFQGWYSGSTQISTETTYQLTNPKYNSIYPKFSNPEATITFNPGHGSYTVSGGDSLTVSNAAQTSTKSTGTSYTLTAGTAESGYMFYCWEDGKGNRYYNDANGSYTFITTGDESYAPVFIPTNSAQFQVGNDKFYDLNDANAAANAGSVKKIVLVDNGTLYAGNYTISAGNTLLIPYDSNYSAAGDDPVTEEQPKDRSTIKTPEPYRTMTMADGAVINVNGAMEVAAKHYASHGGSVAGGRPVQYYGYVVMQGNSQIILNNGAKLYAWGYISGSTDARVIAESDSTIYEKMQVSDYRGGNATLQITGQKVFPFSQYYIQNVEVKETIKHGATLICHATIYGFSMQENTVSFMGDNSMFTLKPGCQATKYYDAATDRLIVDVEGDFGFNAISLMGYDTKDFVLPLQQNLTVNLKSGTAIVDQDIMLQPGCIFNVEEDATLKLSSGKKVYLFDKDDWGTFCYGLSSVKLVPITYIPTKGAAPGIRTASKMTDAKVNIDGTVEIEGAVFASANHASVVSIGKTGELRFVSAVTESGSVKMCETNASSGIKTFNMYPILLTNGTGKGTTPTTGTTANTTFYYNTDCDMWVKNVQSGHSYTSVVTQPTCIEQGYTTYTCSACNHSYKGNYVTATGHSYGTAWKYDGTNHWHECACGDKADLDAHAYDNACDANCNVCGATRTPSAHVYDNACDADCNVCGTTRTPPHNYSTDWKYDGTNHWHECTCGAQKDLAAHVYDNACDADCNVCDATRTPAAHVYTLDTSKGVNGYEWSVDGKTCTAYGKCACGVVVTANGVISSQKKSDATCTEKGWTTYTATFNNVSWATAQTKDVQDIPAAGHKNKVHHEKVDATCVAEGTIEYWSCPDCGKNFSDEACTNAVTDLTIAIDPDNHDLKTTAAKVPTCTEIGWDEYVTCQREGCGYTTYVEKAATDHSWTISGYTDNGETHTVNYVCNNDEAHTKSESGKPHDYKNGVCVCLAKQAFTITWVIDGKEETTTVAYGEMPTHAEPTKAETAEYTYEFTGWTPAVVNATGEATYTAQFQAMPKSYTVTFNVNGEKYKELSFAYGTAVTAPDYETPEGYTFSGWDVPATMPAENITLDATLTVNSYNYTIETYTMGTDGQYGAAVVATQSANYGETVSVTPSVPEGFALDTVKSVTSATNGTGNTVLKVYLVRNQYTITFEDTGDTEYKPIILYYDEAVGAQADPVKTGYTFTGWDVEIPMTMPAKDMTITGTWEINSYTITLMVDGAQYGEILNVEFGETITLPTPIKDKDGCTVYTFSSWNETVPGTMPAENLTFTGSFTQSKDHTGATTTVVGAKDPTCTEKGYTGDTVCECGDILRNGTEIDALGHSFVDIDYKAATCRAAGNEAHKYCETCKLYFAAEADKYAASGADTNVAFVIKQKDHSYTGEIRNDGNGKDSTHSFLCVNGCNEYGGTVKHTWNSGVETTVPGCESEGEKTFTCTVDDCGATYTESIAATGHLNKVHYEKVDATCVATGTIEYWSCPGCGKNFSDEACTNAVTDLTIAKDPNNHASSGYEYVINGTGNTDTHTKKHACCKVEVETVPHSYSNGRCVCGDVEQVTVTWEDSNGNVIATETVDHGSNATTTEQAPEVFGYTSTLDTTVENVKENTTVTVVMTPKTFGIVFVADEEVVHETTITYNTKVVTVEAPEKEGYEFVGWYDANGKLVTNDTTYHLDNLDISSATTYSTRSEVAGRTVLEAKYEIKTYTITWSVNGTETEETYEHFQMPGFSGSTDKVYDEDYHYSFAGWDADGDGDVDGISTVSGPVTYTAVYTRKAHTDTAGDGNHLCDYGCGMKLDESCDKEAWTYTDNGDGTHDASCSVCNSPMVDNESHKYGENGECVCGAEKAPEVIYVAQVNGSEKYETLAAAVAAAEDGDTVTLLKSTAGAGVVIDKDITIDFGGYTYTFTEGVGSSGTPSNGFQILKDNDVTLKNGTLNVAEESKDEFYILVQNYADLTVEGMTLDGTNLDKWSLVETDQDSYVLSNNSGTVNITGNTTIIANDDGDKAFAFDVCKYQNYEAPVVNVNTTGKISGKIEVSAEIATNLNISDGTFTVEIEDDWCAEGYVPKDNGDGTYGVKTGTYVAQVNGGEKYETLAAAVAAAEDDDTVTLLKSTAGAGVVIDKNITIDFGGYTYTFTEGVGSSGTPSNGFQILKDNEVTLKNGTLNVAEESKNEFYILVQNYADLTVEDVTLDGTNLDKWSVKDGDSYVLSNNSGTVNVTGNTTIIANDDGDKAFAFDVCKYQSYEPPVVNVNTTGKISGKIEVSAEIATNLNISGGTFTVEIQQAWCASGFIPKDNGDNTYGVKSGAYLAQVNDGEKYETLAAAVAAAEDGDTVTLLKSTAGAGVVIDKDITIDFGGYTYTFTEGVGSSGTPSNGFQILKDNEVTLKNGTLNVAEESKDKFYILVQNYADLTVEDMTLDGTNLDKWSLVETDQDSYVLSNNSGTVNITGNTTIIANDDGDKAFAFDVCKYQNYEAPVVNVNTTGKISGKIEVSAEISTNLNISGGTFTVEIADDWCAEGYVPTTIGEGLYGVMEKPVTPMKGDVDLDGDVDAYDLTALARHVGGIEELTKAVALDNADVDEDGDVDAYDLTIHARYVGGIILDWEEGLGDEAVAAINDTVYLTLADAVAAAQEGETVTLMKDVVLTEKLTVETQQTWDFGEYTVTTADIGEDNYGLVVKGDLTIESGNFSVTGLYGIGVTGKLTVNGGEFTYNGSSDYLIGNWGETVINGGTFSGQYCCVNNFGGTTEIKGGSFSTEATDSTGGYESSDLFADTGLTVTGGTFSKDISEYCAEGYVCKGDDNGTYIVTETPEVTYVAQVNGGEKYETLAAAVAAAEGDDTVTLLKSTADVGIVIDKNITIDFGGYTYTFTEGVGSSGTPSNGFQILKDNEVTLKNGTLNVAEESKNEFYILVQNYADLTVEDMTLDGTNLDKWSVTDGDSYVLSNNSGTVNITGNTTIIANDDGDKAFAFDVCKYQNYDAPVVNVNTTGKITGKIEVSAEIPTNLNISGGTFTVEIEDDWCAEGYVPKDNGDGTYGVKTGAYVAQVNGGEKYETLAAAVAAAGDDDTVTLLKSTAGAGVVIDKDITIDFGGYTYTFTEGVGSSGTPSNGFQILKDNEVTLKNGTLNVAAESADKFYILVQNYADLTVEDMTLDGTNLDKWSLIETDQDSYVLSNNSGNVNITGETNIIANDDGDKAFAFDVCKYASYDAPVVNVNTTGKISGKIEVSAEIATNLNISGGTFTVEIADDWCAEGYVPKDNDDGTYSVAAAEATENPAPETN